MNPKGEYETIAEVTFWESPKREIKKGWKNDRYNLRIRKWRANNPSEDEIDREKKGLTTKIAFVVYSVHTTADGKEPSVTLDHEFKLNISNFKSMMHTLYQTTRALMMEAHATVRAAMDSPDIHNYNIMCSWDMLQRNFIQRLAQLGWFPGSAVPMTSAHYDHVRKLKTDGKLQKKNIQCYRTSFVSFKNPANKNLDTEDSMLATIQPCNERVNAMYKRKFTNAKNLASHIYFLAATMPMCAVFQRVCENSSEPKDTVYLISPALFQFFEYVHRDDNILFDELPNHFDRQERVPMSANQSAALAKEDGSLNNQALRQLQLANLAYLNNDQYALPPCAAGGDSATTTTIVVNSGCQEVEKTPNKRQRGSNGNGAKKATPAKPRRSNKRKATPPVGDEGDGNATPTKVVALTKKQEKAAALAALQAAAEEQQNMMQDSTTTKDADDGDNETADECDNNADDAAILPPPPHMLLQDTIEQHAEDERRKRQQGRATPLSNILTNYVI
eukprot:Seg2628.5 transcript_id=Seg2628.5/GoldUCD/mRNA.D3Y31 product="hypothetical protein" protein_id=Seg2628.5/GoldUCD/D3Y31